MKRTVIKIDEELCNGCGNCVEGCHEGALQLIDGKAVMVSELYCDGLGACIGDCPVGAIELIEKEAEPYDEIKVMERIHVKGSKVILAHLEHLKNHGATEWYNQGVEWCRQNNIELNLNSLETKPAESKFKPVKTLHSALKQWPVQLHLINPTSGFLHGADLLLASDCSAYTHGSFHQTFLDNKALAIACPKLDSHLNIYVDKIASMIDDAKINTITLILMEVPCCSGLMKIVQNAKERASRNIPVKLMVLSIKGEIIRDEWI